MEMDQAWVYKRHFFATLQRLSCGAVTKGAAYGEKRCTSFGFDSRLDFVSLRLGRYASVDSVRIFGFSSAGKVRK